MPEIEVEFSYKDILKARAMLAHIRNGANLALMRTINKTLTGVRADMVKLVREDITAKAGRVRKSISVLRARLNYLRGTVASTGTPLPLTDFAGTRQTRGGVSVKIKRKGSREVIKHAFIATMDSGYNNAFRRALDSETRKRVGRLPIHALDGPRAQDILAKPAIEKDLMERAREKRNKYFQHEVDHLLRTAK